MTNAEDAALVAEITALWVNKYALRAFVLTGRFQCQLKLWSIRHFK